MSDSPSSVSAQAREKYIQDLRESTARVVARVRSAEGGDRSQVIGPSSLAASPGIAEKEAQDGLLHPVSQVYFRAGLIACREYMARFVEAQDPAIANSIRANWWPSLGPDFGPPRQLAFGELTDGTYGEPGFRCKTAEEVSPTQEALPIALGFLQQPHLVKEPNELHQCSCYPWDGIHAIDCAKSAPGIAEKDEIAKIHNSVTMILAHARDACERLNAIEFPAPGIASPSEKEREQVIADVVREMRSEAYNLTTFYRLHALITSWANRLEL